MDPISTINYRKLTSGDEQALGSLRESILETGSFFLVDTGTDEKLFKDFYEINQEFFKRSDEEKKKFISASYPARGFKPLKEENLARFLGVGDYPDLCMKYTWNSSENVYPSEAFRKTWDHYYSEMNRIARGLLEVTSSVIRDRVECDDQDWKMIIEGDQNLRHLYYPQVREVQELSMAPHTDLGSFSLLYQTPAQNGKMALEVEIRNEFVPVPAVENGVFVLVGELFTHVSNGKIKAGRHRVVHFPDAGSERTSTISFCKPLDELNMKKFNGSTFDGLLTEDVTTYGELFLKDTQEYVDGGRTLKS